jgi:hypothetical protein
MTSPMSGGHRATNTTSKHFIHAGLSKALEFLFIYLVEYM